LIDAKDIVVMDFRDAAQAADDSAPEPASLVPEMQLFDHAAVRRLGDAKLGNAAFRRFEVQSRNF
jgi:hypothetical protein